MTEATLWISLGVSEKIPEGKPANWGGIPGGGNNGRFKWGGNDILEVKQTWQGKSKTH